MRSENQFLRTEIQLLDDLAHVPVVENRVGGEIVRHRDEVRACRGFFAGSGDA